MKAVLSVLGQDRPGIVAKISSLLAALECNIEDISQTILQGEFAAIFIFSLQDIKWDNIVNTLKKELSQDGLTVKIKELAKPYFWTNKKTEQFIITAIGSDRVGQIAKLTQIIADFNCNIFNLKASYKSDTYPDKIVMFYEIEIPENISLKKLKESLIEAGKSLGLEIILQHKNIFENIHRI